MTPRPAPEIDNPGYAFEVIGVDAATYTASMVQVGQGYNLFEVDEERPVSQTSSMLRPTELSVSIAVQGSIPKPATIKIDCVPVPVVDPRVSSRPGTHEPDIMLVTHASFEATRYTVEVVDRTHRLHVPTILREG